jgi:hypothetical protein
MLRPTIALHWATFLLFPLLLQGTAFADSFLNLYDTVYLDTIGQKIKKVPGPKPTVTYIVRTTQITDSLYKVSDGEDSNKIRGWSHPILSREAIKTVNLIIAGKFKEALATKNLVELIPLTERKADYRSMRRDNGSGGIRPKNNQEYAVAVYKDSTRLKMAGKAYDPQFVGADVTPPCLDSVIICTHSHPSGSKNVNNHIWKFSQPPSSIDINIARSGQTCIVFGRGSNFVYIYDSTGVIAVLPTKSYCSL